MQLTKLEAKGFKSFGDKITIHFDKGITGIVGPNGCGKSNVVDAIRWVLGEQKTRMLRSDKMENIIFNGTRKRKPLQMAEVSLTFSNTKNLLPTEYTTVTITRRYYRSGESEYMLNGVTCRLKDITNLFMDTGISSNSYAIIELKMVDDILNDKDNSRRALFEEAAGIAKFKARKKETLRKLEDTDADLARVEDLLFEIDKNMRSLERQAKQAQRYYKLKEEYKRQSVALARQSLASIAEQQDRLQGQIEAQNDQKISLNRQTAEKEAAIEAAKTGLINQEKTLSSRQKALNTHVGKIRQYESDKKIHNERMRFLEDKSRNLRDQLDQDRKSNERAAFSMNSLEQEKISAQRQLEELKARVTELKETYEAQKVKAQALQEETNVVTSQYRQKRELSYQLGKAVEIAQIQLNSLKQELEKMASDTTEQSSSLVEFETKAASLKQELDGKNATLERTKQEEEALQERIQETGTTIEKIKEELTQANRKLDAHQNEYNLTKSLVDNLEGFPEAIRFLKKSAKWGKDAPLLSDIITCDEAYRITIENYLEPYMNYYIVDTEAQAYQAVNLLSDAAKGKAHFFVLEKFERFVPHQDQLINGALPATEIVEYDAKYRKLVRYLLNNVYIAEGDIDDLQLEKGQEDSVFITRSGKITRRPFSISGGSVGLFEGKRIGRAKNLEKLERKIKEGKQRINSISEGLEAKQKELHKFKEATQKQAIETLQQDINLLNQEYVGIKTRMDQFAQMVSSTATKREDLMERMAQLNEEIAEKQPQAHEEQELAQAMEERMGELTEHLREENELLAVRSSSYNQENIAFHQQQNRTDSIEQELGFKQSAFESSKERIEKNQGELAQTEEEIKKLVNTSNDNEDELVEMYQERERIEQAVNEAEKEYYAGRGHIDELEKGVREVQRNREQIDTLLMELQGQLNETKVQLGSVKERLSVEFNLVVEDLAKAEADPELDQRSQEELRAEVQKTKDKIDRVGPINPMAMEAYDEIKERFDFITTQKEDLLEAKNALVSTIQEIDTVAKDTFLEAFEKIKANFMEVFRSLFTAEDEADLRLTDPENPLESSIDIMAKPKGKRPLTINQLSGGEKTLTATSLLFAIYLLKPAPFCIFDEVDAPLDDANIDKFNNIIRTFSGSSQFIIVTHNKRTMASTDIIFGVTMVEQGVSKVVPVDLRELQEN